MLGKFKDELTGEKKLIILFSIYMCGVLIRIYLIKRNNKKRY